MIAIPDFEWASRHEILAFSLTAMALWAGNVIVSKLAAGIIASPVITFYRLIVAVVLMSVFIAMPA